MAGYHEFRIDPSIQQRDDVKHSNIVYTPGFGRQAAADGRGLQLFTTC